MKKTLLSVVLSLAILMTAFGTMLAMPASALNGYDFLAEASISLSDGAAEAGATAEIVDGQLVFTATAADQEVALTIDGESSILAYPFWEVALDSEIKWDACVYSPSDNKWMFAVGDWCNDFDNGNGTSNPINPGVEDKKINITGCYTWNGGSVPETAAIKSITFIAKEAGTMTISKCAMTDGVTDVILGEGNEWNTEWTWDTLASDNADQWIHTSLDKSGNSDIIVEYDAENWTLNFGNTAGNWPSASLAVGATVDYATSAIDVNLNVLSGAQTTLYVFFGDATPDDFEGEGKAYGTILSDAGAGNYSGIVMLSDILPADSDVIDENGQVTVSYIKLYATSGAVVMNPAVIVNWIDLCYIPSETPEMPEKPEGLGDVDFDGDVDTYDALIVYNAAFDVITLTEEQAVAADYLPDGIVDEVDAACIFLAAAGIDIWETEF